MRGVNDEMFPAPGTHAPTDAIREARGRRDRDDSAEAWTPPAPPESGPSGMLADLLRGLPPGTVVTITLTAPPGNGGDS